MLWDIAMKNLWRRKLRTLLTIIGVATAVQLYLTMNGWMNIYERDLKHQLNAFAGRVFVQQPMETSSGGADFPSFSSSLEAQTATAVLSMDGVNRKTSSAVLFIPLARASSPNMPPAALAVGIEPGHEVAYLGSFEMESGKTTLTDANSVILGRGAASRYQPEGSNKTVQPGQVIQIQGHTFTVVGVLKPAAVLFDNSVVMALTTAQKLFHRSDTVSAVIASTATARDAKAVQEAVGTQYPELQALSQDDIAKNADAVLVGQRSFFSLIDSTVIAVAVVVVTIVVVVAVMEQRKEIGTLRAIGARRWRIFSMVVGESMTLSLLGAMVALPFSVLVQWALEFLNNGNASNASDLFTIDLFQSWLGTIAIAIVIGVLASLLPAWQAVRVDPLEALRYE
jgi:putative ABC transport system permease protein